MYKLQAFGSTVQCCAPHVPTLLASRCCLARRRFKTAVRAGVDERSIVGEVRPSSFTFWLSTSGGQRVWLFWT